MIASRHATVILTVLVALAATAGAENKDSGRILAGDDNALWIVNNRSIDDAPAFDVVTRLQKWKWVAQGRKGRVVRAAAVGGQLHVFFEDGSTLVFSHDNKPTTGVKLRAERPQKLMAICSGRGMGPGSLLLAAVVRSAPTTTTTPTHRLEVMRRTGNKWSLLASLETPSPLDKVAVFMTVVDKSVMLLLTPPDQGVSQLHAWSGGKWRRVDLSGLAPGNVPIGMMAIEKHLVIPLLSGKGTSRRSVTLAITDSHGEKFTYQPVKTDGGELTWPADQTPLTGRMGGQLVLLWRGDDDKTRAAMGDTTGTFMPAEDVDIFDRPPIDGSKGEELLNKFLMGLMLVILSVMLVVRPRPTAAPLILPEGVRPALMSRRFMATLIDLLPFPLMISAWFPDVHTIELSELFEHRMPPESLVQWHLLSFAAYTVYSILMEWRFGTTLGKRVVKIRTIGYEGARPNLRETLLRNLTRLIPLCFNPLLPLLVFFPLLNPNRQRLGDLLARTVVIDARFTPTDLPEVGNDSKPDGDAPRPDDPDDA